MAPDREYVPNRLAEDDLRQARIDAGELFCAAGTELDQLSEMVTKEGFFLVLGDGKGIVLEQYGRSRELDLLEELGLAAGHSWCEEHAGTNSIGTSIVDGRPLTIIRDQHFLCANTGLASSSVPLRDHAGSIIATIAAVTVRSHYSDAYMQLLTRAIRDAATRIEVSLFSRAHRDGRVILVSSRQCSPALLAVDHDDIVIGANRAARIELRIDNEHIQCAPSAADVLTQSPNVEAGNLLADAERSALRRALARNGHNVMLTAERLGISRSTLHRKIKRLGVSS
jgi:transcriptional regulator of acetoin/glycerol metabolism